jgi:hypothetical protein
MEARGVGAGEGDAVRHWSRRVVLVGLVVGLTACQPQPASPATLAAQATFTVQVSPTLAATEPAPALVFEEDADPPTRTPLPKGAFFYFWEPG